MGGDSQLDDLAGLEKVAAMKPEFSEPEGAQGRQDPVGILFRRGDEDIKISGEAGSPVEGEAKGANNQILNAMGVEQPDKLAQVVVEPHGGRSLHGRRVR